MPDAHPAPPPAPTPDPTDRPVPTPAAAPPDPAGRLDAAALEGLAALLLDPTAADGAAPADETTLVLVTPGDDHVELAVRPAGGDPAVALRGLVAPDGCRAVGVVAPAHLHPLPPDVDRSWPTTTRAAATPRRPARVALLVDAEGRAACAVAEPDLEVRSWCTTPDDPAQGRIVDAGRRVLGLPTPPPPAGTAALWTALWLERLVADPPGSWSGCVGHHPAATVVPELVGEGDDDDLGCALVEATEVLGQLWDWDGLRRALARGDHDLRGVTPDDARWFDAGSFARAVLERLTDTAGLLAVLEARLPPSVHHRVARTVAGALAGADDPPVVGATGPPGAA